MLINHKKYSAFGLIEVMISAMILSISLLGIASIQSRALNVMIEASRTETAYRMIGQLSHFAVTLDDKSQVVNFVPSSASLKDINASDCYLQNLPATTNCDINKFYKTMVQEWNQTLSAILPGMHGCTCVVKFDNSNSQLTLRAAIEWTSLSGVKRVVSIDNQILLSKDVTAFNDESKFSSCPTPDSPNACIFNQFPS